MLETYEINRSTLAILSLDQKRTQIIEEEREYIIEKPSLEVIDESCQYFGSSFLGREQGSRALIGTSYKAPIIIEETRKIIFIPLSSPKFSNCNWISYKHIDKYEKNGENTRLYFQSGRKIDLNISIYSLENQILRAMKLENTLRKRISFE